MANKYETGLDKNPANYVALSPLELSPGSVSVWDNRLRVRAETPGWRLQAAPGAVPVFEKAAKHFTRVEAESTGEIKAEWLTRAHIAHLLPSELLGEPGAFTPS